LSGLAKKLRGRQKTLDRWAGSGKGPKRRMEKNKEKEFILIFRILFPGKE
jgi:hypothetical protein